jgi:hypothetical protein
MTTRNPAALVAATAKEVLPACAAGAQRLILLRRRMRTAAHDSGLSAIVGCNWPSIGDDSFELARLTLHQSDALVRFLEELADRPATTAGRRDGQLGLF